eukprot:6045097-Pyramimonas_sp.AAC.1
MQAVLDEVKGRVRFHVILKLLKADAVVAAHGAEVFEEHPVTKGTMLETEVEAGPSGACSGSAVTPVHSAWSGSVARIE